MFLAVFKAENYAAASIISEPELAGHFIPHLKSPLHKTVQQLNIPEEELTEQLNEIRKKLLAERDKRIHPFKDDKILTDWNGLMVAALARGAQVFNEPVFAEAARRAIDFILNRMRTSDGRLLHRFRDGIASIPATVDDYAFIIWALIELYEATFETGHLDTALILNKHLLDHFWDEKDGGFYFTPDDGEKLLISQKEAYDGAVPSGNSVSMLNLLRLARITGNTELEGRSAAIGKIFSAKVVQFPVAYTQLLVAFDFALGPAYEVVIAGDPKKQDTQDMVKALRAVFVPNKVVLFRPATEILPDIERIAPFLEAQSNIGGKATAYVCSNYSCQLPTNSISKMIALLES